MMNSYVHTTSDEAVYKQN